MESLAKYSHLCLRNTVLEKTEDEWAEGRNGAGIILGSWGETGGGRKARSPRVWMWLVVKGRCENSSLVFWLDQGTPELPPLPRHPPDPSPFTPSRPLL